MQTTTTIPAEARAGQGAEAALVHAAQHDPTAFAPLYERYRDRIYAYLRTRTRTPDDAADLTQQVFVQALDALPRYRTGRVPFAAWLVRIAHNVAANYHRGHRHTLTWDLLPEALQPPVDDDLETRVARHEAIARLDAVLRTCTADTREMLALHFAARLTVAETAAAMGKSEAAVKKHLYRTLRLLKEHYDDRPR
jgi:RNA polymerase sigma-70 factor (ECF subfamily)